MVQLFFPFYQKKLLGIQQVSHLKLLPSHPCLTRIPIESPAHAKAAFLLASSAAKNRIMKVFEGISALSKQWLCKQTGPLL